MCLRGGSALLPWSTRIPPLRAAIARILPRHDAWAHDESGRVDNPPTVSPQELVALSPSQLDDLKRLAFVMAPPHMLDGAQIRGHTATLYKHVRPDADVMRQPTAVVTVGAPGSGKSYVAAKEALALLHSMGEGPAPDQYLYSDPDFWLTSNCQNDNACRPLVNWLNHETFLKAIRLKQHIFFDGTGKSLMNTCGRVISRLRGAGYAVHLCIVFAGYDSCVSNIAERKKRTGRDVPLKFVSDTIEMLAPAVDVYVSRHSEICERVLVYTNEQHKTTLVANLKKGSTEGEAMAKEVADKFCKL